ncbi:unnamed protein product [Arctia plantaginis]|uniref:Uncharacterized protein n=1 Tax=Arctia plantaginis TaxID=874455 RepID=A0A8S1A7K2_ARCPL|nr:unnamed protein product [Arctia plantaginis]
MAYGIQYYLLVNFLFIAIVSPHVRAQPPTADDIIEKERAARHLLFKSVNNVAEPTERGFFGTIFHVILEQINDTKSAYNQITDLVTKQFVDENAITPAPDPSNNGTTETPKLTRTEFLRILDRNLKGLARLRNLEWREAMKDSSANLKAYKDEIFRGKKARSGR